VGGHGHCGLGLAIANGWPRRTGAAEARRRCPCQGGRAGLLRHASPPLDPSCPAGSKAAQGPLKSYQLSSPKGQEAAKGGPADPIRTDAMGKGASINKSPKERRGDQTEPSAPPQHWRALFSTTAITASTLLE